MDFTCVDTRMRFRDQRVLPYPRLAEVPAIAGRRPPDEIRAGAAGRLLLGGHRPVAKPAGSRTRWLDTARDLVSHPSTSKQDAIFRRNALRVHCPT